jgi:hypothetical protein
MPGTSQVATPSAAADTITLSRYFTQEHYIGAQSAQLSAACRHVSPMARAGLKA